MRIVRLVLIVTAAIFAVLPAWAGDKVVLQLKWVTQALFAGYYVARDKGFYDEVGLDVEIKPGGPNVAPEQIIVGGGADVIVDWMPAALAAREKGVPLVNIAQPFKRSGMMLTCRKETGIRSTDDFFGRTMAISFFGNEFPFLAWMAKLGIPTDGGPDGVTMMQKGFNVDPLLQKKADCIQTLSYNEYGQILDAGIAPEDLVVFRYSEQGISTLEDGLYVLQDRLSEPAFVDLMARFVKASMTGWDWARAHPEDAAAIVLNNDTSGAQTMAHQLRMMHEVNKLTDDSGGRLDPVDYQRTVDTLLSGGTNPVIRRKPEGAWAHEVSDRARAL